MRPGVAVEPYVAGSQGGQGQEEPHHRAGVADIHRGRTAQLLRFDEPVCAVVAHLGSDRAQRSRHEQGVART